MMLLDKFQPYQSAFRPESEDGLLAVLLARHLGEPEAANYLTGFTDQYSRPRLLTAFRRALRRYPAGRRVTGFAAEVEAATEPGNGWESIRLLSIRVERRAITIAVLDGTRLHYLQTRQLAADRERAVSSAYGFVNRLTRQFEPLSAAIEIIPKGEEIQRAALHRAALSALREAGLPVWEIEKHMLFDAFGHPALSSRKELRQVICSIWPELAGSNGKHYAQDAAALGLYVQVERHFLN